MFLHVWYKCGRIVIVGTKKFGGVCKLVEVKFYDSVDDHLLKFAVTIAKTGFVGIENVIHMKSRVDIENMEKIF